MINLKKDYYKILQVSKDATQDEIAKAYKKLAKLYHPDNNIGDKKAEFEFKEAGEAYAVLGDIQKRKEYDNETYNFVNQTTYTTGQNVFDGFMKNDIEKFNRQREEFIKFLDEMEPKFNKYNRTLKNKKEETLKLSYSLLWDFVGDFSSAKAQLRNQFNDLERNAKAFDDFSEYFLKTNQEMQSLYGRNLINYDKYLDPKNRVLFQPKVFSDLKYEIEKRLSELKVEKAKKLNHLREELEKKGLDFSEYFVTRKIDERNISLYDINTMLKSMKLIDQINGILTPYGLTIEDLLKQNGKKLIDMRYIELLAMKETIENYIKVAETENLNFADLEFEDVNTITKKLDHLKNKLEKKGLDFLEYFRIRGINPRTTSVTNINTMLKSMELIDQINGILTPYGLTIEDLLKQNGKKLIDMRYIELLAMKETIENYIKVAETENLNFADLEFEDVNTITKKLDHLKNKLEKKGLDFLEYFRIRGINPRTTSVTNINTMLKSMELIDQINEILLLYGTTLEEFLKDNGKELIDIRYKELLEIKDAVKNFIKNADTEYPYFANLKFEDNETIAPPSGSLRN